jgi:inner membrane protein
VEPLTHALLSLILARASQKHLPRYGAAMLVVSGVAADLDYASYFGGPQAFLRFHRTLLHSFLGSALLIAAVALTFWAVARQRSARSPDSSQIPLRFAAALAVCTFGAATHVLFDLCSGIGVQLLWPFRQKWTAWSVLTNRDPWVLVLLVLGLLLPEVFRLVSEEIGERKKGPRGQRAAVITLLLLLIYLGVRADLHSRAIDQLSSREYHGQPALATGAFPSALSPFAWRGLVSTDNAIDTIDISLAPGAAFDPDSAVPHYKPEASPALDAAQNTPAAKLFLRYARFPLATLEREDDSFQFTLRDLRFESSDTSSDNIIVHVNLNANLRVTHEEFRYANSADR